MLRVLHLQGHDLLLLAVGQVISRDALLRGQPVPSHLVPFVTFVVKCGEGEDVEEEERCADGYRHAQFRGVVSCVAWERRKTRGL